MNPGSLSEDPREVGLFLLNVVQAQILLAVLAVLILLRAFDIWRYAVADVEITIGPNELQRVNQTCNSTLYNKCCTLSCRVRKFYSSHLIPCALYNGTP